MNKYRISVFGEGIDYRGYILDEDDYGDVTSEDYCIPDIRDNGDYWCVAGAYINNNSFLRVCSPSWSDPDKDDEIILQIPLPIMVRLGLTTTTESYADNMPPALKSSRRIVTIEECGGTVARSKIISDFDQFDLQKLKVVTTRVPGHELAISFLYNGKDLEEDFDDFYLGMDEEYYLYTVPDEQLREEAKHYVDGRIPITKLTEPDWAKSRIL